MSSSVLIVVAHPDDEVLGCGATAAELARQKLPVRACFLSGRAMARHDRPADEELLQDTSRAQRILGLGDPIIGDFPNMLFNTVAHLELVQFIEKAIRETAADVVFTHHPADLNNDHLQTSLACQAAVRLFQRQSNVAPLRQLFFMEVLSSTDWAFPGGASSFQPDTLFEINDEGVTRKMEALKAYRGVMRPFPHPRSPEIIRGLAAYRGGQAGMRYAEAFQTGFHRLQIADLTT
jgi:LmbE family N-acetylglucosaminyl deacetylase